VRSQPERYKELLSMLEAEDFVLKQEYASARKYFDKLTATQKPTGDGLFDLFQ
jgi:hypothetical protein